MIIQNEVHKPEIQNWIEDEVKKWKMQQINPSQIMNCLKKNQV